MIQMILCTLAGAVAIVSAYQGFFGILYLLGRLSRNVFKWTLHEPGYHHGGTGGWIDQWYGNVWNYRGEGGLLLLSLLLALGGSWSVLAILHELGCWLLHFVRLG